MGLFGSILGAVGSLIGGNKAGKSADKAAQLQYDASKLGIAETGRQFDLTRADYAPATALLAPGAQHLGDLVGTNGNDAQMSEIDALKASPLYQSLFNNGQDAMLASASATGGLRGGNFQDASQRFGADTLSSVIAQQLSNYGGLVGIGTGAAGSVGNFGQNAVAQQNLLRGQGADALGQAALLKGGIANQNWNNIGTSLGGMLDKGGSGGIGNFLKSLF